MRPPVKRAASSGRRVVTGGSVLAAAMLVANAGNYSLSLFLGRVLTPAEFSDANLMVTTLFGLTSIALCLQLVAVRFIARSDELGFPGDSDLLARRLRRVALVSGVIAGLALAAGAPWWSATFRTASPWPFVILGAGVPFWLVQAVERGVLQARLRFGPLGLSFVVEMVTRVGLGVLIVSLGGGVSGATVALSASFVITYAVVNVASRSRGGRTGPGIDLSEVRAYTGLVSVLLIGQIIVNNSDILVAKAFLTPTSAGVYAAVALVGRAVFFLAWSVATVVLPVVGRRHATGRESPNVARTAVAMVVGIGAVCAAGALWIGGPVLAAVLGPAYAGTSAPMAAYASMTTLFAVGNLIAGYPLSQSRVTESWLLLSAALLQLALLLVWHQDMAELIAAQSAAMTLLVTVLGARALARRGRTPARAPQEAVS